MKEFKFNKNKPLVNNFSHVMWDEIYLWEDLFKDTGDWFAKLFLKQKIKMSIG